MTRGRENVHSSKEQSYITGREKKTIHRTFNFQSPSASSIHRVSESTSMAQIPSFRAQTLSPLSVALSVDLRLRGTTKSDVMCNLPYDTSDPPTYGMAAVKKAHSDTQCVFMTSSCNYKKKVFLLERVIKYTDHVQRKNILFLFKCLLTSRKMHMKYVNKKFSSSIVHIHYDIIYAFHQLMLTLDISRCCKTYLLSAPLNATIFTASNHASFENRRVNLTAL